MNSKTCPIARKLIRAVLTAIKDYADAVECPKMLPVLKFRLGVVSQKEHPKDMEKVTLTNEQKVNVILEPQTAKGKPITVDGPPKWSVVQGDATLEIADDGLSADIISPDVPGVSQILITADADLGAGSQEISTTLEVEIVGARAESLGLKVGTPVTK